MSVARSCRMSLALSMLIALSAGAALLAVDLLVVNVDAASCATKKKSKDSPGGKDDLPDDKTAAAETGQTQARFVEWSAGVDRGAPVLMIVIAPPQGGGNATLPIPNRDEKDRTINPPENIVKLAEELKIGDLVTVSYAKVGTKPVVTDISIDKHAAEETPLRPFVFVRTRMVRVDKTDHLALMVSQDRGNWTLLVPNAPQPETPAAEGDAGARKPAPPKPTPDAALSEKLKVLRPGDLLTLDYSCSEYRFILKDVTAFEMTDNGALVAVGSRKVGQETYQTVTIRTAKGLTLLLVRPDSPAATALKDLQPKQPVTVKYVRTGAQLWLAGIGPKTADEPEAPKGGSSEAEDAKKLLN